MVYFRRTKHIFLSPKTKVRGIVLRKMFKFSIASFGTFSVNENKLSSSPKTGVLSIFPGGVFEFCIAIEEFQYIFKEWKQTHP